jgi:acetylornithine deacetylase/succinyl-diaminopimelate desuccinylase-like protein
MPRRAMTLYEAAPLVHSADERIPVADLGTAAEFFTYAAERICG